VLADHGLRCLVCYMVISWGCVVECVRFRCHVVRVLLGVEGIMGSGCGGGLCCTWWLPILYDCVCVRWVCVRGTGGGAFLCSRARVVDEWVQVLIAKKMV
jgi:hypothetical protein